MTVIESSRTAGTVGTSHGARYALLGLATTIAAIVLNALVYFIGGMLVSYDSDFLIFQNVSPTIIFTVVPAIIAVLLYGVLRRFTARPERTFTVIAAVVLLASIIPDLTYIPTVDGASPGQTAILIVMHVVAAATIVRMLTRFAPGTSRRTRSSSQPVPVPVPMR